MVILVIVLLVVFAGMWYISTYNSLKVGKLKINEALSGIDVALTKRYDVLTKLVGVVKGYQKHEQELLTEVIKLRSGMTMKERADANQKMDELFNKIQVMVENYPDIKAGANFVNLQKAVLDVEEHLQAARRLYNSNVTSYNTKVVSFPSSIIASNMGAKEEEYFEAEEYKRSDVEMTF